jgi:phytoene dehydrogenase-like protein
VRLFKPQFLNIACAFNKKGFIFLPVNDFEFKTVGCMMNAPGDDSAKQVVIIGAGPAGLATAVMLARRGYTVNVFEKNLFPGGRCGRIVRDGFRFDTGATMMLMPGMYREAFEAMSLDFEKDLPMVRMEQLYTLCFDDGSRLAFSSDPETMHRRLEAMEPGSGAKAADYIHKGHNMYKLGFERLLARNFPDGTSL